MVASTYIVISSLLLVNAAVFHVPLQIDDRAFASALSRLRANEHINASAFSKYRRFRRDLQQPLSAPNSSSRFHRVEIWDSFFPQTFATAAALGNPPQPFRLNIDMTWDTLFVPSVDCDGTCNEPGQPFSFQSNLSSTFQPGPPGSAMTLYAGVRFEGPIAYDTLRVAGLEIEEQVFINAETARTLGFIDLYFNYDGVLGLAPRWNSSLDTTTLPSPWLTMVNQSLLDANLFAIDLPHTPFDLSSSPRVGELSFGGTNPKYNSSTFTSLSLSDYTDRVWAIEAQSFTWTNRTHPIHTTFSNFTLAGFDTSSWYIGLPSTLADEINAQVQPLCTFVFCYVPCSQRHVMPDFVFGIGGKEVRVSAMDYAQEVGQGSCTFNVLDSRAVGGFPVDAIVLGTPVMNAFYSVFDLDRREVRLAKPLE